MLLNFFNFFLIRFEEVMEVADRELGKRDSDISGVFSTSIVP